MSVPNKRQLEQIVFENKNMLHKYLGGKKIKFLETQDHDELSKIFFLNITDELFIIFVNSFDETRLEECLRCKIIIKYNSEKNTTQRAEISLTKELAYNVNVSKNDF
tara:strand:- start:1067 stop:1387 length:321 start_codon:yes stop_codon:yes gene_type:complete